MGDIGQAGTAGAGPRIEVQIGSLADFAAFVGRELGASLESAAQRAVDDQAHGRHWGSTVVSRLVDATRVRYLDAHTEAVRNMGRYLAAGAVMIDVIDELMRTYRTSEELAGVTSEQVLAMLRDAPRGHGVRRSLLE